MRTLHVIMPVYNEPGTLDRCVERVLAVPLPQGWRVRIVMIDDFSDVAQQAGIDALIMRHQAVGTSVVLHRHSVNRGKGAALQTGFDDILAGRGADDDLVIIQDADLEYDPNDYPRLMQPLIDGAADAVLGSRWGRHRDLTRLKYKIHAWGNQALTQLSNLMTGYRVSDMECCYKLFSVELLRRMRPMLSEMRFGIEPQIVAALSRLGARVVEAPVSYDPRGIAAGKKIGWKDGVRALMVITRERLRGGSRKAEVKRQTAQADRRSVEIGQERD